MFGIVTLRRLFLNRRAFESSFEGRESVRVVIVWDCYTEKAFFFNRWAFESSFEGRESVRVVIVWDCYTEKAFFLTDGLLRALLKEEKLSEL